MMNHGRQISLFVLPLDTPHATLERVGGKGASLARMAAAGLSVPPGFHITTDAYRHFVATNNLQKTIQKAMTTVNSDDLATLEDSSTCIGIHFAESTIPSDIVEAICQAYVRLGGSEPATAVRSSATAEDLPGASFAGQQESYLNIRGEARVLNAVKRCWASLWTARAIGYRIRHNIVSEEVSLAVVVQRFIPADAAGILFTANPLTGARNQIMINAAWGLGEAIVGGFVTPDTVVIDKVSGMMLTKEIADKEVMTVSALHGTHEEPVPTNRRRIAVLSEAQGEALRCIAIQIEQLHGQPMDIEWAIADKQFFVLQARPITTLPEDAVGTGIASVKEWKLPKPGGCYMRSSVIELLPDPLSPLFATLALPIWNQATHEILREMGIDNIVSHDPLVTINGFAYYDITITPMQAIRLILMVPRLIAFIAHMQRTAHLRWQQQARPAYLAVINKWDRVDLETTSATQMLNRIREILTVAAKYYLTIQDGILLAAYRSEAIFTVVYEEFIKRSDDPRAQAFLLGYSSSPIEAEKSLYNLAQWVCSQEGLADILKNMSSEQFLAAYRSEHSVSGNQPSWSQFQRHLDAHLARFGHAIYDLDFVKPVLADDPTPLLEPLKFFLSGQASDPYIRQATTTTAREQAEQALLSRLRGIRLVLFRRLMQRAQSFAPLREDALADVGLGWPLLRCLLREIGQRLAKARRIERTDNVFWLTADEIETAALALDSGRSIESYQTSVIKRQALWRSTQKTTPPVVLPKGGRTRFLGIDFSRWLPAATYQEISHVIKGIGASPGRVTGPVRVLHATDEFNQMRPGEILVARVTTLAWTPLFTLAKGVVTDIGGPLSHSSIVAREYHIPAVLGTGIATECLYSGQLVTVDGDAGTVTVINE